MPRSIVKKRKRQFYGNRFSKTADTTISKDDAIFDASSSKLEGNSFAEWKENTNIPMCGNRIFDLEIMSNLFSELCCPSCFANGLFLHEESRYGLCSHFALKCKNCDFCKGFASSKKSTNVPEINSRLVYGMRQIGKGFSSAYKLCATLNMPGIAKSAYANHEDKLLGILSEVAQNSMNKAANEVVQKRKKSDEVAQCGISVDGTWQRRGYTSMNGCVAAISIDTGKVLDIEVMSSYCRICKRLERMPKNIVYDSLKADHICQCNFEGSASKMETVGASRIFLRSIKERELKYVEYYGDGDSKAFSNVKDTYGQNSVVKLECIGHVQKRVGSRLRKLKSQTKGLSGKGKLTNTFIDRLQNYYGISVRTNVGNLQKMQQNAIASLFHCASSATKPMHGQCPVGKESWCYYQRSIETGSMPKVTYNGLPQDILNTIKPTYLALCTRELLEKCLHGKTQNANECLNSIIWQRIPKEVFVCLKIMKLGVYDAVVQFNGGYHGSCEVFETMNIVPGFYTVKGYERLDSVRIRSAKRQSALRTKKRRKLLTALRKKKTTVLDNKEGGFYKTGAF